MSADESLWVALWKAIWKHGVGMLTTPAGGIGIVEELGSGFSLSEAQEMNAAKLKALCEEAVVNPAWVAWPDGRTFCNRSVDFIAQGMGYFSIRQDSADQIIAHCSSLPEKWTEEHDLARVEGLAAKGALVILGVSEEPHGHVVVAYPGPAEESTTWGEKVPLVAQVGSAKVGNGIKRLSAAFKLEARPFLRIFVLEESIA